MKGSPTAGTSLIYYRLISLWVLSEALLGGIIHGLKIPVSGLIVGSCAVICIALIGWYVPKKGMILKATVIVAIFKMMLSPQAPPPAYIAVFFQGLLGELLLWNRRFFRLSCMLLAVLALLESGLQRILMLTIVYGNDLWKVINDFVNGLLKQKTATNYSLIICSIYAGVHVLVGILVGWWSAILPSRVDKWGHEEKNRLEWGEGEAGIGTLPRKKKKKFRIWLFIVWIVLIGLYVQSHFRIGDPLLPAHISLKILLRSLIIVMAWYFVVGPLLKALLHVWLKKKSSQSQSDVQQVLQLLPSTRALITKCWQRSSGDRGIKRLIACGKLILVNALQPAAGNIYILTAPIQTGKTTSLMSWVKEQNNVEGILTPVVDGRRMFMNIKTGESFPMEAEVGETDTLSVGKFVFSKRNFDKAVQVIRDAKTDGWLVVDEVGPMELRGEGFSEVLKEIISKGSGNILLVVREGLVDKVKEYFGLRDVTIINKMPSAVSLKSMDVSS